MYGQFPTNFFFPDFSIFLLFCGKKNLIFFKNILKREKKKIDEKKFEIENLQNNWKKFEENFLHPNLN